MGTFADNVSLTQTHALKPYSVVIDATNDCIDIKCNPITTDQSSVVRFQNGQCDIGAFEQINLDGDPCGYVNWGDLWIVLGCFGQDPALCNPKADVNGDGIVNIPDFSFVWSNFTWP